MASTTTLSAARQLVRDRLDDQTFDGGIIDRAINSYIFAITAAHNFIFLESSMTPPTITQGNNTIALPSDYQELRGIRLVAPTNYLSNLIDAKASYNDFYRMYPSPAANPQGTPVVWTEYGNQLIFANLADQTYTYNIDYMKAPALATTDGSVLVIPDEFIECVTSGATYRIQNRDDDYDLGGNEQQFLTPLEMSFIKRYGSGRATGRVRRMSSSFVNRRMR